MLTLIDEQLLMIFRKNISISDEILMFFIQRALQNGYLQSGGDDINVLSRYSNLERRLRHYEYYPWLKDYPEPLRHYRCKD
jgi:hypothetical protein